MDNVSEITRKHLRSKLAWVTAISLLPITIYAGIVFIMVSQEAVLVENPAYGIVVVFIAGVCLDFLAHIFCCVKGSKKGILLRICAIALEVLGVFTCLIWLCTYIKDSINDKYMTPVYYDMAVAAFVLLILLWRILEIISLTSIEKCLKDEAKINGITLFTVIGIILAVCLSVLTISVWNVYIGDWWGIWWDKHVFIEGLMCLGLTSVPVYVFSMAFHFLKIRKSVKFI